MTRTLSRHGTGENCRTQVCLYLRNLNGCIARPGSEMPTGEAEAPRVWSSRSETSDSHVLATAGRDKRASELPNGRGKPHF